MKDVLFASATLRKVLFLNEHCSHTFFTKRECLLENVNIYYTRLVISSMIYISSKIGCTVRAIVSDEFDPLHINLKTSNLKSELITIRDFVEISKDFNQLHSSIDSALNIQYEYLHLMRNIKSSALPSTLNGKDDYASTTKYYYPLHLSREDVKKLIKEGKVGRNREYVIGKLNKHPHDSNGGEIQIMGMEEENFPTLLVQGKKDMNRALDGDTVLVKVLQTVFKNLFYIFKCTSLSFFVRFTHNTTGSPLGPHRC